MNKRQYQVIGEALRRELIEGGYRVGDRLPPERDIAQRLNVSRATVRDALIMLELEELVEVKKGSGVYVINLPQPSQLGASSIIRRVGGGSFDRGIGPFEHLQARQLIVSHIAEFAASQATKNDVVRLMEALELEKQDLRNESSEHDGDKTFHIGIAKATQNSALVETVQTLWSQRETSPMWQALHSRITVQDYRHKWLQEHERIFFAIKNKQALEARHAMWQHLESVKQTLLDLADVDDPAFDGYLFDANPVQVNVK